MRVDPDGLREALARALELSAREAVARHRGDRAALSPAEVLARHDWIESPEILEARAAFTGKGLFSSEEAAAFEWHVRRLRREVVLAASRHSLETLHARRFAGQALGEAMRALALPRDRDQEQRPGQDDDEDATVALRQAAALAASVLLDRRTEADARAGLEAADPDRAPEGQRDLAQALLLETEDAYAEARDRLGLTRARDLAGWTRALRSAEHDAIFTPAARLRRLAGFFPGFGRELGDRVRALPSVTLLGPRPRVLAPRVPGEVRLVMPSLELGLLSEIFVAESMGRALMTGLTSPALPPALRWPTEGTVGRALGWIAARAIYEPAYAKRDERLRGRTLESIRARGELAVLFARRFAALAVLVERGNASQGRELAATGLGLELGQDEVILAMLTPSGARARLRALAAAERLYGAFVERYDEDFMWNPRFEEPLRAAGERGALLSVEAWAGEFESR